MPGTPALAGVLVCVVLLVGCATPQVAALIEQRPEDVAPSAELSGVPFFPQEDYECGPASLAEVLGYSGVAVTPESLLPEVYVPGREGSLQTEMLAAVRRHGRVAYRLAPRLADVLREVSDGTPVVVLQNLTFSFAPTWHYAVVIGYDVGRSDIVLRSGTTRRLSMTLSNFETVWARSGYWAMVAMEPQRLPRSADEASYVEAVAALERLDPRAARTAYDAALQRWPASLAARLGQGNAAYTLHDLPGAESAYRRATQDHPDSGDAWNNLAQSLADLHRKDEAIAAARRAVRIGGPRLAQYQATLQEVAGSR